MKRRQLTYIQTIIITRETPFGSFRKHFAGEFPTSNMINQPGNPHTQYKHI